jgi:hypothetical protein
MPDWNNEQTKGADMLAGGLGMTVALVILWIAVSKQPDEGEW